MEILQQTVLGRIQTVTTLAMLGMWQFHLFSNIIAFPFPVPFGYKSREPWKFCRIWNIYKIELWGYNSKWSSNRSEIALKPSFITVASKLLLIL